MKKIVHIIIGLNVGGAELMLQRLIINSSSKKQFEHSVISLTDLGVIGPELQKEGIKVHTLGMKSLISTPFIFIKLTKLLSGIKPDVVQTWMYHSDFIGGIASRCIGVNNIVWGIRTTNVSLGSSKLTTYLSRLCAKLSYIIPDKIICAAHASKEYHVEIGYDETKMIVIPNGYNLEALSATREEGLKVRYQNNLTSNDIVIGSIGRFAPIKNQKLFIETAAKLIKDSPDLKFMIVGRDNTTDNQQLMSWIKYYGIEKNFRLLGQRSDIPQCLKAMDIFCLHSKTEGFPNILVEAVAAGLPCVSVDVGDAKYILSENDYIVHPNDSNELKTCIQQVLNHKEINSTCVAESNRNSLHHLYSNFDINIIEEKYASTWNNL